MLIFRGYGLLVLVFVFGCSLTANLIANKVSGSEAYWEEHMWPVGLAQLCAGGLCWVVGTALHRRRARRLMDPETGEEVVLAPSHDLFFIKMEYWGIILSVAGVAIFIWGAF